MGYKVLRTESAERDLDEIISYLVEKLCNPPAAVELLSAIDATYTRLEETPFRAECRLGTSNLNTPDLRLKPSQPIRRRRASGSALGRSARKCASMRARDAFGASAYI